MSILHSNRFDNKITNERNRSCIQLSIFPCRLTTIQCIVEGNFTVIMSNRKLLIFRIPTNRWLIQTIITIEVVIALVRHYPTITLSIHVDISWLCHLNRFAIIERKALTTIVVTLVNDIPYTGLRHTLYVRSLATQRDLQRIVVDCCNRSRYFKICLLKLSNDRVTHTILYGHSTNCIVLRKDKRVSIDQRVGSRIRIVTSIIDGGTFCWRRYCQLVSICIKCKIWTIDNG